MKKSRTLSVFTRSSEKKASSSSRSLKLESLENRELLSATTWESPSAASVAENAAIVQSAQTESTPISLATLDVSVEKIEATPLSAGSNRANIEWTSVEGATKYYLMSCSSTDGVNYSAWTSLKNVNDPGDGSATVSTQLTLTAGKYYKFKVRAAVGNDRTDYTETEDAIVVNKPVSPAITSASVEHTSGFATIEFDTVANANFYRVDYTFDDGATWQFAKYVYVGQGEETSSKIFIDADVDTVVLTHKLNANKTYQFRVRATNDCGSSEYTVSDPISYKGAAAPASVVAAIADGSHYATITWSASESATEYIIETTTNGGSSWSGVKKASADSFTYDAATDSYSYSYFISTGKTYQYRVRAYNDLGSDGNSTVSNEIALAVVGAPENFTVASAEAVNPTTYPIGERYSKVTVTLTWDAVDNATKYVVKYAKDGDSSAKLLKNINDPSVTSVTFGAVAGSYYDFSIMAINSLGYSEEVTTGVYAVYKASLNRVDVVEGETLEATTVAPADVTTVYQWQYRTANGDWADIVGATESSYTPTSEDVANQYWIRVLVSGADAACPAGSYVAEAVAGPVVESVNAPSDFTFGDYDAETNALPMSWVDNSDNEDGFYVEYSIDDGATWSKAAWLGANVTERVGKVYADKVYQFRVRAFNASGYSAWAYSDPYELEPETPSLCVTTLDDVVDKFDNEISLREAIAYAVDHPELGTEITFASSLSGKTVTVTEGELSVTLDYLAINGADQNITVSSEHKSRIFSVEAQGVWFRGLMLAHGAAEEGAGVVVSGNSTVEFVRVKFQENVSTGNGGAVLTQDSAKANFTSCIFLGNSSGDLGGALYTSGSSTVVVETSEFLDNLAVSGGGAFVDDSSTVRFTNTVFTGNEAYNGGAIYASNNILTLEHVSMFSNVSTHYGGGLNVAGANVVDVYNSIIYANTAASDGNNIYAFDTQFDARNNLTYISDCSEFVREAFSYERNSIISDNDSLAEILHPITYRLVSGSYAINAGDHSLTPYVTKDFYGISRDEQPDIGATEYLAPETPSLCVTTLDDVVDEYDYKISLREAIAYQEENPNLGTMITFDPSLNGLTITLEDGELAISRALSISAPDQDITVSGDNKSRIFNITGDDVLIEGLTLASGSAEEGGAVLMSDRAYVNFFGVKFDGNASTGNGGALLLQDNSEARFTTCVFTENNSGDLGGAIYTSGASTIVVETTEFRGNSAVSGGAVLTEGSGESTFTNTVFSRNEAYNGGAIYAANTALTLAHVTVIDNVATHDGGGLNIAGVRAVKIYNSIVYGNTAASEGHNVYAFATTIDASHNLTYASDKGWVYRDGIDSDTNVLMSDNDSLASVLNPSSYGLIKGSPAIDAGDNDLTPYVVKDFTGNDRDSKPDIGAFEYVSGGKETPSLCVTTPDDSVDDTDGYISLREAIEYAAQYPYLGTMITFSSDLNGKTITLEKGELTVSQPLTFVASDQNITVSGDNKSVIFSINGDDVLFEGLTFTQGSGANGGAFELLAGSYTGFSACTFTNNSADSIGGAVYMLNAGAGFTGCKFSNNTSVEGGGAVFMTEGSKAEFDACVFTNNSTEVDGGAVYVLDNGTATFVNTVFSGNEAEEGGAISASGSGVTLKLYHTTVVDNGSQEGGGGLALYYVGSAEIYNSIIYGNYDMLGYGSNVISLDSDVTAINNLTWIESDDWWTETGWEISGGFVINSNVIELADNNSLSSVIDRKTYELVDGSPAINAGEHNLTVDVVTDINGKDRDSLPDLGAFEYVAPSIPTLCVNTLSDLSGDPTGDELSLRQALAYATNNPDEDYNIIFDTSLNGQTITLTNGELNVPRSITVNAAGQNITVSGDNASRIFNVTASGVTVEGLTLTNGSSDSGGAVYIASGAIANFTACVFTSNTSSVTGGAVYMDEGSSATFTNSVFSGNIAGNASRFVMGNGGAIYVSGATTTLTLEHSTVVANSSSGRLGSNGGGFYIDGSTCNIYNSIIYKNTARNGGNVGGSSGTTVNARNVLTSTDNRLWSFSSEVSKVEMVNFIEADSSATVASVLDPTTFQLVDGSAAIDAGDAELTPEVTTDLYGVSRDSKPDLGACEYRGSSSAVLDDVFAELDDDLDIAWEL